MPSAVALIPARSGSKRLASKNIRPLGGHPLLAYTVAAARRCGQFAAVIVSTDSPEIAAIARDYGAEIPFLRPAELAGDLSPDIDWLRDTLARLETAGRHHDIFALLRPTNPFRHPETIQRAFAAFGGAPGADSLRAVEPCRQHPGKMWTLGDGPFMRPLLDDGGRRPPWHSTAYQGLPPVYAQNASLEIAWSRVPLEMGTIAGENIVPFVTEDFEGFDINRLEDWLLAETLVEKGLARLPAIDH